MRIAVPMRTRRSASTGGSLMRPTTFTALAARTSLPWLAGVRPKKTQNASPGGQ